MPLTIFLSCDEVLENIPHIFLLFQFPSPHFQEILLGFLAFEIEEIIVLQVSECRTAAVSPSTIGEVVPVLRSEDVGLGSGTPEDGTDVFLHPFGVRVAGLPPWKHTDTLFLP